MVDTAMLRPHKDDYNQAITTLFAGCARQEVVSAFGVNVEMCGSSTCISTSWVARITHPEMAVRGLPSPDMKARFALHTTTDVESAATISGRENQCISSKNVCRDCEELYFVHDVRTFELLLWLFHLSISTIGLCSVQDNAKPHVARVC
jgi:hypothetical protein